MVFSLQCPILILICSLLGGIWRPKSLKPIVVFMQLAWQLLLLPTGDSMVISLSLSTPQILTKKKDSIYTERYMLTPELNPEGYTQSAVNNMTGFEDTKYLLIHGTGDDNGTKHV